MHEQALYNECIDVIMHILQMNKICCFLLEKAKKKMGNNNMQSYKLRFALFTVFYELPLFEKQNKDNKQEGIGGNGGGGRDDCERTRKTRSIEEGRSWERMGRTGFRWGKSG